MSISSRAKPTDLPGFYYDPEKNRYFRVLPGTNNHNPLTEEVISTKKVKVDKVTKTDGITRKNSVDLLHQRCIGLRWRGCHTKFETDMTHVKLKNCTVQECPNSPSHPIASMHPTSDFSDVLLYYWQHHNCQDICAIGQKHIHGLPHCSGISMLNFGQKGVLCACAGASQIIWWDYGRADRKRTVKGNTPFACASAMSPNSKYVASFGDGHEAIFITNLESFFSSPTFHVRGGPGYTVARLKKDILAQSFSYDPNIHYNGLRGGSVVGLDKRMSSECSYFCYLTTDTFRGRVNVRQIRALSDEFSLIVGYQNTNERPLMHLWDARFQTKPVLQYHSGLFARHQGQREHINFTMNIDKDERIITSVLPNTDYRVRLWSIKTGEIVAVYPEVPSEWGCVSAAAYTKDWEGIRITVCGEGMKFLSFKRTEY